MLTITVRLNSASDLGREVQKVVDQLDASDLDVSVRQAVTEQVREVINTLIEQGRAVAGDGGAYTAARELSGDGYRILCKADFRPRGSAFGWLRKLAGVR